MKVEGVKMNRRDYFAGIALEYFLPLMGDGRLGPINDVEMALSCFDVADAMITATNLRQLNNETSKKESGNECL